MKNLIAVFALLLLSTPFFAQSQTVNITGGTMFINIGGSQPSRLELNSSAFSSVGNIVHLQKTTWYSNCNFPICQPGTDFSTPTAFMFYDMHEVGDFTLNGTTHENVWYEGGMDFTRETFSIPRIARKKGLVFFEGKFEMNGAILVCKINPFANGCPPEQTIYRSNIAGHGKLIVRLRSRLTPPIHWFRTENYEYIFQP